MKRTATLLATILTSLVALAALAQEDPASKLARVALENAKIPSRSDEQLFEDYARYIKIQTFAILVKGAPEREARDYEPDEVPYVGERGTMTKEQVDVVKYVADALSEIPRREPTEEDFVKISEAFDLPLDRVRTSFKALFEQLVSIYGEDPRDANNPTLFGEKLPDNPGEADPDEIAPFFERALDSHTMSETLAELNSWNNRTDRMSALVLLLNRFKEKESDLDRAILVRETLRYAKSIGQNARPAEKEPEFWVAMEEFARSEADAKPESWPVAAVVATHILGNEIYAPKTILPENVTDDPNVAPKRQRIFGENLEALSCAERDRVLALQILIRAQKSAIEALGEPAESETRADGPRGLSPAAYFGALCDALRFRYLPNEIRAIDLRDKTDLTTLPSCKPVAESAEKEYRARSSGKIPSFVVPNSFEEAESDGERFVWASIHQAAAAKASDKYEALALLGSKARSIMGVGQTLRLARESRARRASPESELGKKHAALEELVAEIPKLADDETIVAFLDPEVDPRLASEGPAALEHCKFERRKLSGAADFMGNLRKALELGESGEVPTWLAQEYQLRGNYDAARELWKRAMKAESETESELRGASSDEEALKIGRSALFDAPVASRDGLSIREIVLNRHINARSLASRALEAIASRALFTFDRDKSRILGPNVKVVVKSRSIKEMEAVAYQLDLSDEIAATRSREFRAGDKSKKLVEFFVDSFSKKYNGRRPLDQLGVEAARVAKEVSSDSADESGVDSTTFEFTFEKPGLYAIRVSNKENRDSSIAALAQVRKRAIVQRGSELYIADLTTGEPLANAKFEAMTLNFDGKAKWLRLETDENGATRFANMSGRLFVFIQAGEDDEFDRSVDCFDLYDPIYKNVLSPDTPGRTNSDSLVLATDKPVYRPGETARFRGFFGPHRWDNFNEGSERLLKLAPPRSNNPQKQDEVALTLAVKLDKNGVFTGEFEIPKDATSGEWRLGIGPRLVNMTDGSEGYLVEAIAPIYVSTVGDASAEGTGATSETVEVKIVESESQTPDDEPLFKLEFDKSNYKVGDEATCVLTSKANNVVASIYRYAQNSNSAPETKIVRLVDGRAEYRFVANATPFLYLMVDATGDGRAERQIAKVGAAPGSFERDAKLIVPTEPVASGSKVQAVAEFGSSEAPDSLFAGTAALSLSDAKLDLVPDRGFEPYVKWRVVKTEVERRDVLRELPLFGFAPIATLPAAPSSPSDGSLREKIEIYDDFLPKAVPLPTQLPRPQVPVGIANNQPAPTPVPPIPASASDESALLVQSPTAPVASLTFEFDAPKTPGTYELVLSAIDDQKRVVRTKAQIAVK